MRNYLIRLLPWVKERLVAHWDEPLNVLRASLTTDDFGAQWRAWTLFCQRFTTPLARTGAGLEAELVRYSFLRSYGTFIPYSPPAFTGAFTDTFDIPLLGADPRARLMEGVLQIADVAGLKSAEKSHLPWWDRECGTRRTRPECLSTVNTATSLVTASALFMNKARNCRPFVLADAVTDNVAEVAPLTLETKRTPIF